MEKKEVLAVILDDVAAALLYSISEIMYKMVDTKQFLKISCN